MIEVKEVEPKTVAEIIRGMNDEDLNSFLFKFKINSITRFLERGGAGLADTVAQMKILQGGVDGARSTEFIEPQLCLVTDLGESKQFYIDSNDKRWDIPVPPNGEVQHE